ncbi:unnamed protein product [Pleuronectes platessa]|uniref:Uncharacterized protein n=1 Tax=Pleuronectes platessa TaxID=8262 RepID=A0A9N7U066_PLEPL|nr:unnamed protein product [Pleuronectes platessa]
MPPRAPRGGRRSPIGRRERAPSAVIRLDGSRRFHGQLGPFLALCLCVATGVKLDDRGGETRDRGEDRVTLLKNPPSPLESKDRISEAYFHIFPSSFLRDYSAAERRALLGGIRKSRTDAQRARDLLDLPCPPPPPLSEHI